LTVDTTLESSRAPIDELNGSLGLDDGDGSSDILGDDVSSVHEAARHVLAVSGITLGHHVGRFEESVGQFSNGVLFVVDLVLAYYGSVRAEHEVNSGIRNQVGLELVDIDVEGSIETKRSSQGGDDLGNQSIQVGVRGSVDAQIVSADIVDGFVIQHEGNIGMFQEGMSRQDGVVRFHNGSRDLRGRIDTEVQLGLLSIIDGETFQKQRTKSRSSSSSNGMEDEESLKSSTVIGQLADMFQSNVDQFLSNGIMTTSVVVGGIFLASDQFLGMKERSIGTGSHFIDHSWFQVNHDGTRNVLSRIGFREEGVEGIGLFANRLVVFHGSIWIDSVF
jgi:hypothetical protein